MVKVIIPNFGNGLNKGAAALLSSRIKTLKKDVPDSEFTIFTFNPGLPSGMDDAYIRNNNIKFHEVVCRCELSPYKLLNTISVLSRIIVWPIVYKIGLGSIVRDERFKEYANADIVMSIGGDVLTEDYGTISYLSHMSNLFFGLLFDVPIVICAESVGPFKKRWNQIITKYLFNRASLITLRDDISREHIEDIGVKNNKTFITNDFAFLLEPISSESAKSLLSLENIEIDKSPIIGISLSQIISHYGFSTIDNDIEKYNKYITIMADAVDYLIEKYDSTIIFVAHVTEPGNDDRTVAHDVCKVVKSKKACSIISNEYTAEELKGIIGLCDMFIGSRMHATIASTSMLVPTIAVAYSHKTYGIIGDSLKQNKYVLDIRDLDYGMMVSKIDAIFAESDDVKKVLELEINKIKEASLLNAKLIENLIDSKVNKNNL